MSASIQDLDHWAEDKFSSLCAAAGVTRNRSAQDRTGWDYLIEFPAKKILGLPSDMQPVGASARVQIKSKRNGRASIKLKLSNALRFAKDPSPCFLVLIIANNGAEPVRIFARHCWETMIADTLCRARTADVAGKTDHHKQTVSMAFTEADDHTDDLLSWMESTLASIGRRYPEAKDNLVRTVGVEDGALHGSISFPMAALQEFVDHQIGLVAGAPLADITINQRRFGIDAVTPLFAGKPSFASLRVHPQACRLRLRGQNGDEIWMDADLFVPGVPRLLSNFMKVRIVADFLELIYDGSGSGAANLTYSGSDQRSLAGTRTLVDVLTISEAGPIDVSIRCEGGVVLAASVSVPRQNSGSWLEWFSPGLHCLENVAVNAAPDELTLSIQNILDAWSGIVAFNGLVAGTDFSARVTLADPLAIPLSADKFVAYDYVDVGDWSFLAVVARPIIQIDVDRLQLSFTCGIPRIIERLVRRGTGQSHLPELRTLYQMALHSLGGDPVALCDGDYRALTTFQS